MAQSPANRGEAKEGEVMTIRRFASAALLAGVAWVGMPAGAVEGVCTWGGTPLDPTGVAYAPGITNHHPAAEPIEFWAEGALAGVGASCTGSMRFDGVILPGAVCRLFFEWGTVSGVPGVTWFFGQGSAYGRGFLYNADGKLVGTYDPQVITEVPELTPKCLTPEGLTDPVSFSATVEFLPA